MKSSIESSDGYILSFTVKSQEGGGRRGTNVTPGWARWVGVMKGEGRWLRSADKQKDTGIKNNMAA